jgi:hypothetical protein
MPVHSPSAGHNQSGHYRGRSQPQKVILRVTDIAGGIIRQCNEYCTGRELRASSPQRRRPSQLNPNADRYSQESTINYSPTEMCSQTYLARETSASQCRGPYVGLVWAVPQISSDREGVSINRSAYKGKSHCKFLDNWWRWQEIATFFDINESKFYGCPHVQLGTGDVELIASFQHESRNLLNAGRNF